MEELNNSYTDLGGQNVIVSLHTGTLVACGVNVTEIPAGVQTIGERAFKGFALTEITIPSSVIGIESNDLNIHH